MLIKMRICELRRVVSGVIFASLVFGLASPAIADFFPLGETFETSRFSDEKIQLLAPSDTGNRPPLIYEAGDDFLGQGDLQEGFETPWGAVWQPQLWVFGTLRTSLFYFDNGVRSPSAEWATRLDLFANLQLTHTEKLIIGVRPLDRNQFNRFTRVQLNDEFGSSKIEPNMDIRTLFFEGDFGSLFPGLDPMGTKPIDVGFSVGRQALTFQNAIMINDTVDAIGLVRNNIRFAGISGMRSTVVYGWNELNRSDARLNSTAEMIGFFNSIDTPRGTVNVDSIYIHDDLDGGDSLNVGLSSIQRIGHYNTAFRINKSFAEQGTVKANRGTIYSSEVSWTPYRSDDIAYVNAFAVDGTYTQAGRESVVGGPLGGLGILFASPSIGNFLSELNNFTSEVAGVAIGYEAFWSDGKQANNHRRSLTVEVAARKDLGHRGFDDFAFGFEFRTRLAQRIQLQVDASYSVLEKRDDGSTIRTEIRYQF
ncbi:MAG: hypothetical protein HOH38_04795 [Nitrospinaceae bacterium]|jgi:hypothetical protein|nr:hypothetical protein [Nitrospina sp.]MBT5868137.1 hypothetical protein [Nitrospinaceae bacterium]MBT6347288.1 hypothetical protein [Nitrospina sp.]